MLVMFSEESVMGNKIDKLTFLDGKVCYPSHPEDSPDPSSPECIKMEKNLYIILEGTSKLQWQ